MFQDLSPFLSHMQKIAEIKKNYNGHNGDPSGDRPKTLRQ